MIQEHAAKSELWIFHKIFELQLLAEPTRGEGGGGWASSLVTPPLPTFLVSTLEIKLELHWWEASARSQLLHLSSLLLSNCRIISTLIIT